MKVNFVLKTPGGMFVPVRRVEEPEEEEEKLREMCRREKEREEKDEGNVRSVMERVALERAVVKLMNKPPPYSVAVQLSNVVEVRDSLYSGVSAADSPHP